MPARVTFAIMLDGFGQACARFVNSDLPYPRYRFERAYVPLVEALNWAVAIDLRLQHSDFPGTRAKDEWWRDSFELGPTMRGVAYARNHAQHEWADVLRPLQMPADGHSPGSRWVHGRQRSFEVPNDALNTPGVWSWIRDLPLSKHRPDKEGRRAFREHVANRLVRRTLADLDLLFRAAGRAAELDLG